MYSTYLILVFGTVMMHLCLSNAQATPRYYTQLNSWYPEFGPIFQSILEQNCTEEYHTYLYGTEDDTPIPWRNGGGVYTMYVEPTVQCLLEHSSEYLKASLIVSQIILGLTPTVLASVGVSSIETALISVVGQRPLLAVMLALASPATFISRAFKYNDIYKILDVQRGQYRKNIHPRWQPLLVALQYVFAAAAIANVMIVNWNLGIQAICMISANYIYFPMSWTIAGIVLHAFMVTAYWFRIKVTLVPDPQSTQEHRHWISRFLDIEFRLLGTQRVQVQIPPETLWSIVLHWCYSMGAIGQLIYGTVVFTGMLFIGPRDAILILLRYILSSMICRTILMFELAGLREGACGQLTTTDEMTVTSESVLISNKNTDKV